MAKDKTPSDVSKMIKDSNVKLIDFKFTDLLGTWQHFTTTLTEYNEEIFADGLGFDGSSIRGWRVINASYMVDSAEGHWNSAREEFPNLGYKIRAKEGYFPVSPMDSLQDIRNEMCLELEKAGVAIERQHHEVATAGQAEIDIRFAPLKRMGDNMQYYKYILRNVAKRHNKTVTFMPKPIFADNGSGMHIHMSPSPRCFLPVSMESRTAWIPVIRSTKIYTNCRRKNSRKSPVCPIRFAAQSKRSRPIIPSCCAATSSTRTSSPTGST